MSVLTIAPTGLLEAANAVDVPPPEPEDEHSLATEDEIDGALTRAGEKDEALRQAIRLTLASDDVQRLAEKIGVDSVTLKKASDAVDTLEGAELEEAARNAAALREGLTGGATVTISLIALLLIIIIVILLA